MVSKKSWSGEGESITAESVLQGITPYTMVPKSDKEIKRINAAWQALQQATATTPTDIAKTSTKLKVEFLGDFQAFYRTMPTFTNFIHCLFTARSPFYIALKTDVIGSLATWTDSARSRVTPHTLACFTWAVFKQSTHFALGKMPEDLNNEKAFVPEWRTMVLSLRSGQNIDFLNLPQSVAEKQQLPPKPTETPLKRPADPNPYDNASP